MPGQMPDPASPNQGAAKVMKLAKYLSERLAEHDGEDVAKEAGMRSDRLEAIRGGEMPSKEELSALAKCLRVKESHLSKLAAEVDDPPQAPQEPAGKPAAAPADGAPGDDSDPLQESKPPLGLTALTALYGRASAEEKGVLVALAESHKTVTALSNRLATIEKEKAANEVASTVDAAIKSGKITPAQKAWATELGTKEPKMLRSYLSVALPRGPGVAAFQEPEVKPTEADLDMSALTALSAATGRSLEELKAAALEGQANDKHRTKGR